MRDQVSRRGLLKAAAGAAVVGSAGCMSSGNSNNNSKSTENAIKAKDMEWMERTPDLTYAEIAEESAQMSVGDYNENMQMSGTHIDSAPEKIL